jgi:hypothetical protein
VVSEHLVRLKLAEEVEEEEQDADAGINASSGDDHPSVVILNGLRLEDEQYVLRMINAWIDIDRSCAGGGLQKISKLWVCIRRPSR